MIRKFGFVPADATPAPEIRRSEKTALMRRMVRSFSGESGGDNPLPRQA
jgi:hypothetical protein